MKAMIFAAGLGTRLGSFTKNKPKALVKINDKSMLEYQLEKLIKYNFKNIIVNTHHFSQQIKTFIQSYEHQNLKIEISDESDQLLNTGGGLIKALPLFQKEKALLIHNVDIFSDLNISEFYNQLINSDNSALLAVKERETQRYLLFDNNLILCGWENIRTGEKIIVRKADNLKRLAFSGIHCIKPHLIAETKLSGPCSVIDIYLEMAKKYKIKAHIHNDNFWIDAGKPRQIRQLAQIL
ncbi:MAG: sugar phosphate nucleotidyltransferase [Bacteroidales bacterium]